MKHEDHQDPGTAAIAAVAALARTVEGLARDVAAMKKGLKLAATAQSVTHLAGVVDSLTETLGKPAPGKVKEQTEPVRSWLTLPDDRQAVEAVLAELLPWMQLVYLRYSDAQATLPPCWLWHPDIVEELVWLMDAWTLAFEGPEASTKLVGDWHDRQRPGVMRRVGLYATGCDLPTHLTDAGEPIVAVPLAADADPFVTWWASDRDHNGPAPTPDQIRAGRRGGLTAVPDTAGDHR
ncbi:hypothetical protein [Kribbella sp. NPDC006257]|uniref:hypothetical protein n=1 Tax=Kribbella sp. NPDC006257 TaxID=3156738 RepID=UPI0033AE01CC